MQNGRRLIWWLLGLSVIVLATSAKIEGDPYEQICRKNREFSENYLSYIAQKPTIHVIIPNKLYYEVLQKESESVTLYSLFHYKIMTVDETILANTYNEGPPKHISLTNAIVGFVKGVQGMSIGEKRKLYIHPDLAYRTIGVFAPPQSLIIIEVEAF